MFSSIFPIKNLRDIAHQVANTVADSKFKFVFLILVFFFIPDFAVRLGCVCLFVYWGVNETKNINRVCVASFLFIYFCVAYIFSPYYALAPHPGLKVLVFAFLILFGLAWSFAASSEVRLDFKFNNWIYLCAFTLLFYLINKNALYMDIPWRGDEAHHIDSVYQLSGSIYPFMAGVLRNANILLLFFLICGLLLFFRFISLKFSRKKALFLAIFPLTLLASISLNLLFPEILNFFKFHMVRYPYLERWFCLPFVLGGRHNIALYRAVPFLSANFIGWFLFAKFSRVTRDNVLSLLLAVLSVTVPLIYWYSTLLYLEMPIVLLIVVFLFDFESFLAADFKQLRKRPGWYCLLLACFLKETIAPFCGIVFILRFIYQFRMMAQKRSFEKLLDEGIIAILLLSPLMIYLIFRALYLNFRPYGCEFVNLVDLKNWRIVLTSLWTQLGFFMLPAVISMFQFIRKGKWFNFLIFFALIFGISAFYISDKSIYIGFSRWNLSLFPAFLVLFYCNIISLSPRYRWTIVGLLVLSNFFLAPIKASGVRVRNWEVEAFTLSGESIYPYQECIKWLSQQKDLNRILFLGQDYYYYSFFYFGKYNYFPRVAQVNFKLGLTLEQEWDIFSSTFESYASSYGKMRGSDSVEREFSLAKYDAIVYHSTHNIELPMNSFWGEHFQVVKKFDNSQNALYVLENDERLNK